MRRAISLSHLLNLSSRVSMKLYSNIMQLLLMAILPRSALLSAAEIRWTRLWPEELGNIQLRSLIETENYYYLLIYPLLPSNLQFMLTKKAPTQNMRKMFMKSSFRYCFPSPKRDKERAKKMQMRRGPHRSQCLRSFIPLSRCLGSSKITYLILWAIEINYLI